MDIDELNLLMRFSDTACGAPDRHAGGGDTRRYQSFRQTEEAIVEAVRDNVAEIVPVCDEEMECAVRQL